MQKCKIRRGTEIAWTILTLPVDLENVVISLEKLHWGLILQLITIEMLTNVPFFSSFLSHHQLLTCRLQTLLQVSTATSPRSIFCELGSSLL